jgi:hypothetical protein
LFDITTKRGFAAPDMLAVGNGSFPALFQILPTVNEILLCQPTIRTLRTPAQRNKP